MDGEGRDDSTSGGGAGAGSSGNGLTVEDVVEAVEVASRKPAVAVASVHRQ